MTKDPVATDRLRVSIAAILTTLAIASQRIFIDEIENTNLVLKIISKILYATCVFFISYIILTGLKYSHKSPAKINLGSFFYDVGLAATVLAIIMSLCLAATILLLVEFFNSGLIAAILGFWVCIVIMILSLPAFFGLIGHYFSTISKHNIYELLAEPYKSNWNNYKKSIKSSAMFILLSAIIITIFAIIGTI